MKFNRFNLLILLVFLASSLLAQTIHVPEHQPTIQEAINASNSGDTIVVAPGEYFENINFKGKNIVLGSRFLLSDNPEDIKNTIINGSQPVHSDTASCVLFITAENENCVLAGFTLTGGTGTYWEDEHNRGSYYMEGGGILVQEASPVIRNNIIINNEALKRRNGVVSSGGGALRSGDGSPTIINNLILNNKGRYGAGIVLNYSRAIIRNNIIAGNSGGQDFGGGGIWAIGNVDAPILIENNTIVGNKSSLTGGGIRLWSTTAILNNNIIYANTASSYKQIHGSGTVNYCNVQDGRSGEGNIDVIPGFYDYSYTLPDGNHCIDGGNPHSSFNDPEDPVNPGMALFPAQGTTRNDMGAHGGPGSQPFPAIDLSGVHPQNQLELSMQAFPNPASDYLQLVLNQTLDQAVQVSLVNLVGQTILEKTIPPTHTSLEIDLKEKNISPGVHFLIVSSKDQVPIIMKVLVADR